MAEKKPVTKKDSSGPSLETSKVPEYNLNAKQNKAHKPEITEVYTHILKLSFILFTVYHISKLNSFSKLTPCLIGGKAAWRLTLNIVLGEVQEITSPFGF